MAEKYVDESWKENAEQEKDDLRKGASSSGPEGDQGCSSDSVLKEEAEGLDALREVNFINYITSMALQALIFMGDMPNPMAENKIEMNFDQAKFLIDTLIMIRDKTKGNLEPQEDEMLNAALYELQLKFVERTRACSDKKIETGGPS